MGTRIDTGEAESTNPAPRAYLQVPPLYPRKDVVSYGLGSTVGIQYFLPQYVVIFLSQAANAPVRCG